MAKTRFIELFSAISVLATSAACNSLTKLDDYTIAPGATGTDTESVCVSNAKCTDDATLAHGSGDKVPAVCVKQTGRCVELLSEDCDTITGDYASDDAVVIRRKKARRYIYSEPTTTVIRKKRYVSYSHPSTAVIVKKRRAGIAVDSGVSTRTTVRSRTSVGAANPSRANPSASVRERSSGQGTVGAGGRTGGESGGRSGASDGGAGASTTGRQ